MGAGYFNLLACLSPVLHSYLKHHSQPHSRSSSPASARWVCSAGAGKRKQAARSNFVFDVGRIAVKFRHWKAAAICGALALSFSASSGSAATYGFGPGVNYLTFSRPGTAGELVFATGGLFANYAPSAHFPDDGLGALASSGITLLDSGGQTIYVLSGIAHVCFDQGSFCAFNQLGGFHSLENVVALVVSLQEQTIGDQRTLFRWVHL